MCLEFTYAFHRNDGLGSSATQIILLLCLGLLHMVQGSTSVRLQQIEHFRVLAGIPDGVGQRVRFPVRQVQYMKSKPQGFMSHARKFRPSINLATGGVVKAHIRTTAGYA